MSDTTTSSPPLYGLLAEFDRPDAVLDAARRAHAAGYRRAEAYTPFVVEGLDDALGFRRSRVPLITLLGGIFGGAGGFFMCWYANVFSYPLIIAGRPYNSWPAWIPITFEMTVLGAALAGVLGMLALNGLPKPYHPLFNVDHFGLASRNRFFLCISSADDKFDVTATRQFLESLAPLTVAEVPW